MIKKLVDTSVDYCKPDYRSLRIIKHYANFGNITKMKLVQIDTRHGLVDDLAIPDSSFNFCHFVLRIRS